MSARLAAWCMAVLWLALTIVLAQCAVKNCTTDENGKRFCQTREID